MLSDLVSGRPGSDWLIVLAKLSLLPLVFYLLQLSELCLLLLLLARVFLLLLESFACLLFLELTCFLFTLLLVLPALPDGDAMIWTVC